MFDSRPSRSITFWTIVSFTITANIIVAAIAIRLTSTSSSGSDKYKLGLAASMLDVCSIIGLFLAIGTRRLQTRSWTVCSLAGAIIVGLVAAILSIIVFTTRLSSKFHEDSQDLLKIGVAFWVLLFCLEAALYAYLAWPQSRRSQSIDAIDDSELGSSPARSAKAKSIHLAFVRSSPPRMTRTSPDFHDGDNQLPSPPFRPSWRNSMDQMIRPMTSKTRLIRRSFMSSDARSSYSARPQSTETTRHYDGFESWDTSGVESTNTDNLIPPMPPLSRKESRTKLEPIPGSRPVSPAKPLDGPFVDEDKLPEHLPLPESPSIAEASSANEYCSTNKPSTTQHIHPLFRPESPFPSPLPTPGTVITASPLAGQVVSAEHAFHWTLHSSQTWRPGSATPGSPTASRAPSVRSRAGSVRSLALQSPGLLPPPALLPKSPLAESADISPG